MAEVVVGVISEEVAEDLQIGILVVEAVALATSAAAWRAATHSRATAASPSVPQSPRPRATCHTCRAVV